MEQTARNPPTNIVGNRFTAPFAGSAAALHFVSLRSRAAVGSPLQRLMPIANLQRRISLALGKRFVAAGSSLLAEIYGG
jgi:hypothetical protein